MHIPKFNTINYKLLLYYWPFVMTVFIASISIILLICKQNGIVSQMIPNIMAFTLSNPRTTRRGRMAFMTKKIPLKTINLLNLDNLLVMDSCILSNLLGAWRISRPFPAALTDVETEWFLLSLLFSFKSIVTLF